MSAASAVQSMNETEKESWPGPFATAYEIMNKRDNARKHREEQLALRMEGVDPSAYDLNDVEDLDEVDLALKDFTWNEDSYTKLNQGSYQPESLMNLCIDQVVQNMDLYSIADEEDVGEESSLVHLPIDLKTLILTKLAHLKKLSNKYLLSLYFR
jgi:hypothetical protein